MLLIVDLLSSLTWEVSQLKVTIQSLESVILQNRRILLRHDETDEDSNLFRLWPINSDKNMTALETSLVNPVNKKAMVCKIFTKSIEII